MPRWRCSRCSRSRIWRCTVTSSAVVGSSAISSLGSQAMAMAIATRWRMPPDISCGYWRARRSGSGMPTSASSSTARLCGGGAVEAAVELQALADLLADLHHRIERGHRILEDDADVAAEQRRATARGGRRAQILAFEQHLAADLGAGPGAHQADQRAHQHRLARPRFAHDAERAAAWQVERHAVDGAQRCRAPWRSRRARRAPTEAARAHDCRSQRRPARIDHVAHHVAQEIERQHGERTSPPPGSARCAARRRAPRGRRRSCRPSSAAAPGCRGRGTTARPRPR